MSCQIIVLWKLCLGNKENDENQRGGNVQKFGIGGVVFLGQWG